TAHFGLVDMALLEQRWAAVVLRAELHAQRTVVTRLTLRIIPPACHRYPIVVVRLDLDVEIAEAEIAQRPVEVDVQRVLVHRLDRYQLQLVHRIAAGSGEGALRIRGNHVACKVPNSDDV